MEYPCECESEKKLSAVQEATPPTPPPHPLCDVASVALTQDGIPTEVQLISNELWVRRTRNNITLRL